MAVERVEDAQPLFGPSSRQPRPLTVGAIVGAPINSGDITVERRLVGKQVVSRYVRKSDGTPVASLSETWHLMGVEGGFDPPPS
jgi:hypothetical protein